MYYHSQYSPEFTPIELYFSKIKNDLINVIEKITWHGVKLHKDANIKVHKTDKQRILNENLGMNIKESKNQTSRIEQQYIRIIYC